MAMNRSHPLAGRSRSQRNGSAILTVMFVIMVMMIVAGSLHAFSSAMPRRVRLMTDAIRAKAIAEAGINRGYSMLREDYAGNLSAFPLSDAAFAGGGYHVRLVNLSTNRVRLVSDGHFGAADALVGIDARNAAIYDPGSRDAPLSPFAYAIFANGNFFINGTPEYARGFWFTNNDFILTGHYTNVEALIFARNAETIPERVRGNWSERPFPQLTDPEFAEYVEDMRAQGLMTEFNGNTQFPRDATYNGIVVVRGDIVFNGQGTRVVNGMLYVTGNATFNGSSSITVNGAFIVGGNLDFNGESFNKSKFTYSDTHLPPIDPPPEDHVVIDAWWD
jgi:hypothetical protein